MARAPHDLGRPYQLGYVTSDMAAALDTAGELFGVRDLTDFGAFDTVLAAGPARLRVAQGRIGDLFFELIEPLGGADALYRSYLPATGPAIRLHHLAYHLDDPGEWAALRATVAERGIAVMVDGRSPSSEYMYIDLRDALGHHVEVVHRPGGALSNDEEWRRVSAAIASQRGPA